MKDIFVVVSTLFAAFKRTAWITLGDIFVQTDDCPFGFFSILLKSANLKSAHQLCDLLITRKISIILISLYLAFTFFFLDLSIINDSRWCSLITKWKSARATRNSLQQEGILHKAFYLHLLGGIAMPYPLESKRPPTWVRSQFLSITYSMEVDSIRNA